MSDLITAEPRRIVLPKDPAHEFIRVMTHATVEKRTEDYDVFLGILLGKGLPVWEAEHKAALGVKPYEIVEGDFNAMVDGGITLALALLVGGGGTAFNNANAALGVGASVTAWNTTQTVLLTTPTYKAMKATYPQAGTKKQTFQSDFLTGEANIVWNEWGIFNGTAPGTMLSRKQENLGTKSSGTWTLTADFSLA